jgi:membrane-associated phospholipid phosphatase
MIKSLIYIFLFFCSEVFAQNLDIDILRKLNRDRPQNLDKSMQFLTNSTDFVAIGTPLAMIATGYALDNAQFKKEGMNMAIATFGTYSVGFVVKKLVNRPRPYITYPYIQNYEIADGASFPSGSTSLAFSSATSVALSYPKWYVIAPAALYASSVAYSRMHLGAHYPSDVLAGAVLGAGSAILSRKLNKLLTNEYRKRIVLKQQ